jgi:hypothetical protein
VAASAITAALAAAPAAMDAVAAQNSSFTP